MVRSCAAGDVVVVTIDYRLRLFGFLDLSAYVDEYQGSGNNGIVGQICALEWVSQNIADYGSEADNITILLIPQVPCPLTRFWQHHERTDS